MNNLSPLKRTIVIGVPAALALLVALWLSVSVAPGMLFLAMFYSFVLLAAATFGVISAWIAGLLWSYREMKSDGDWMLVGLFLWILIPGFLVVIIFMGLTYTLGLVTFS